MFDNVDGIGFYKAIREFRRMAKELSLLLFIFILGVFSLVGYYLYIQHYKIKVDAGIIKPPIAQSFGSQQ